MSKGSRTKSKPKGHAATNRAPVSDEVLLQEVAVKHTYAQSVRALVTLVGLAFVVLATWPLAHEFAGKDTQLNVTIAFGLTISLTVAGAGVAAWGAQHRRRANRLQTRNDRLSRDVKELQSRLRANHLPDSVSRG